MALAEARVSLRLASTHSASALCDGEQLVFGFWFWVEMGVAGALGGFVEMLRIVFSVG
jgi:hypothetical protein